MYILGSKICRVHTSDTVRLVFLLEGAAYWRGAYYFNLHLSRGGGGIGEGAYSRGRLLEVLR